LIDVCPALPRSCIPASHFGGQPAVWTAATNKKQTKTAFLAILVKIF
jgi:hypothetical protein